METIKHKKITLVDSVKVLTQSDIAITLDSAFNSKRFRDQILIHDSFDEKPQRFINCLTCKSYVRPHMHVMKYQWELMCWLSGEIIAIFFDNKGVVTRKISMNENNVRIIEVPEFCFHSFVTVDQGAYLEVRNCKYEPAIDRVYSDWSPPEGSEFVHDYQAKLLRASVGDQLII